MKTIELTDEQYKALLILKNYVSIKVKEVTNPEVLKYMIDLSKIKDPEEFKKIVTGRKAKRMLKHVRDNYDFQPEYTFGECIEDVIGSVMLEQQTGEVNYIT